MGETSIAAVGVGERADPQAVLADRVAELYGQMWLAIFIALAIAGLATFELWDPRLRDLVLFWWAVVLLASAACAALL
jgi:hypothetical protein